MSTGVSVNGLVSIE